MNNMTIKVEPKTSPEGSQVHLDSSRKMLLLDAMTYQNETKLSLEYFDELLFSLDGLSISTVILYLMGLCIIIPGFCNDIELNHRGLNSYSSFLILPEKLHSPIVIYTICFEDKFT